MKRAVRLFSLILVLSAFAFMALGSDSDSYGDSTEHSPTAAVNQPSTPKTPDVSPAPGSTSAPITGKPERNGFNEKTNTTIVFRQFRFSVPDYWNSGEKSENSYSSLCFENESEGKCARLNIGINGAYPLFDILKYSIELGEFEEKLTKDFENIAGLQYFSFKKENFRGFLFSWNCTVEGFPCNVKYLIWPSSVDWCSYFIYCEEINTDYSYSSDFIKILDSITETTNETAPSPTPKADDSVSYSTNGKNTVKNGNSGIYSYAISGSYDVVYIIDFDEGYVYRFLDTDAVAEKVKIVSGDLNSVVIITYYDDGFTWSNGLHFKWKDQPDHVILEDDDGFEYDLYTTNLSKALAQLEMKKIYDYSPP